MSRPAAEVAEAHAAAAFCVHELRIRRWQLTLIAKRLGVTASTVHRWKLGQSAPRTEARMQRLIALTRAGMQDPIPVVRVMGVVAVVEALRAALRLSARGMSRRLSLSEGTVARWRLTGAQPGRAATLKVRALVLELDLPNVGELLNLCDWRLRQLGNERLARAERFARLNASHIAAKHRRRLEVQNNRAGVQKLKERASDRRQAVR